MKAKLALVTVFCVCVSGCATVDLADMGGTSSPATATNAENTKVNVVQRAASKLYSAFTSQGWVAKRSRKRVQSAASVLLRGLDTTSEESPLSAYASSTKSVTQIRADISDAQVHVVQTTKAAEVYLAMAPDAANLREELSSLQKALIATREAEIVFKNALVEAGTTDDAAHEAYCRSVDELRDVTDAFGDRVRSSRTLTSALQREMN